ncbi:YebB family permuted papain-like enzyme [Paludibacterium denitrificans]|uniref:YebB family permuted papain-like enzyme n=1 Tax=Paludibacterium denitrificans TaxID=2675226 RepID=A0A844GFU2_9NEIS|nr:YebB family permuted papain-like enzyme [Paludibacterium denitrificans]MTD33554.1 YebB family permuted papain-like enzyme [Paludibacterium denitrificans]
MTKRHLQSIVKLTTSRLPRRVTSSASACATQTETCNPAAQISLEGLSTKLTAGDILFIRVPAYPFHKVAETTQSWTNHVGIVVEANRSEVLVAESKFPLSRISPLARFLSSAEGGRISVQRLNIGLTDTQQNRLQQAARARLGVFYDTGFNLHSKREFCSRYVHEIIREATGTPVGEVETFSTLLTRNPRADLGFWTLWYFGNIPWNRETITPASMLRSAALHSVFDGYFNA